MVNVKVGQRNATGKLVKKIIKKLLTNRRGDMNIGGILMMGIGMVFLAVGFIMFPIATDAAQDLIDYSYSSYTVQAITDETFTGYTAVVGITPILILVGFLSAAVITGFLGFKVMKSGAGSSSFSPGSLMLLGLSIVFIAIGLIIEPVMLDGVAGAYTMKGSQTNTESVATAVGQTTANTTLTYELWNGSTSEVDSVSSNATETPAVVSYNSADNHLLVSGLSANNTRTLTVVYKNAAVIDGTSGFTGLLQLLIIAPMLAHIGFLVAAVFSGFFGIKRLSSE